MDLRLNAETFGEFLGGSVRDTVIAHVDRILMGTGKDTFSMMVRKRLLPYGEISPDHLNHIVPLIVDETLVILLDMIHSSEYIDLRYKSQDIDLSIRDSDGPGAEYIGLDGWTNTFGTERKSEIINEFNQSIRAVFKAIDFNDPWPRKNDG